MRELGKRGWRLASAAEQKHVHQGRGRGRLALFAASALAAPMFGAGAAVAQDAPAPEASGTTEIVVTATRREERLIDVGAAVTALGEEQLRESRVEQVRDVVMYVPNTDIKEQWPGIMPVVTIRGVGLDDISTTNSPAAGVYVDEVPLSSLALMNAEFYDLQRVEVVKGPQGTLYGRNSTAGAINIISAAPEDEFGGRVSLTYGNYETLEAEGMFNAPLSESAALRISVKGVQSDGFWESDLLADGTPGNRSLGARDVVMGRVQLRLAPNDAFENITRLELLHNDSDLGVTSGEGCNVYAPPLCFQDPNPDPYRGSYIGNFPYESDLAFFSNTASFDFDAATLTSVTGYIDYERLFFIEGDGMFLPVFHTFQSDDVRQFTQELRLEGETDAVDWLVGVFGSWDNVVVANGANAPVLAAGFSAQFDAMFGPGAGAAVFGVPPSLMSRGATDQTTRSYAGFVNGTWHLSDRLDLITGVRYTWEERRFAGVSDWTPNIPGLLEDASLIGAQVSDNNISYRVQLNFKPTDDSLLFASIAEGTKSGGFYSAIVTDQDLLRPYLPETLRAYEVGGRIQTDSGLLASATLFYYDYSDMQAFISIPSATGQTVGNIPSSEIYGADLDLSYRPTQNLTLGGSVGYLNTSLGSFPNPLGGLTPAGNQSPNSPEVSATGLIRYEFPLAADWSLATQLSARYSDSFFREATNNPNLAVEASTVVDARVALFDTNGDWEVAAWGKNLTDEITAEGGQDVPTFGILIRTYGAPRTYGVSVSRRF